MFFLLLFFNCNKDDDNSNEPCVLYSIFISDNCDCNDMDFNCGDLKFIPEEEFIRLTDIQENSTEPCIYIESEELSTNSNFEGYLINLTQSDCNFDIEIPGLD